MATELNPVSTNGLTGAHVSTLKGKLPIFFAIAVLVAASTFFPEKKANATPHACYIGDSQIYIPR